jgi:hypothetical protein
MLGTHKMRMAKPLPPWSRYFEASSNIYPEVESAFPAAAGIALTLIWLLSCQAGNHLAFHDDSVRLSGFCFRDSWGGRGELIQGERYSRRQCMLILSCRGRLCGVAARRRCPPGTAIVADAQIALVDPELLAQLGERALGAEVGAGGLAIELRGGTVGGRAGDGD